LESQNRNKAKLRKKMESKKINMKKIFFLTCTILALNSTTAFAASANSVYVCKGATPKEIEKVRSMLTDAGGPSPGYNVDDLLQSLPQCAGTYNGDTNVLTLPALSEKCIYGGFEDAQVGEYMILFSINGNRARLETTNGASATVTCTKASQTRPFVYQTVR
jgi:hypothetical protein